MQRDGTPRKLMDRQMPEIRSVAQSALGRFARPGEQHITGSQRDVRSGQSLDNQIRRRRRAGGGDGNSDDGQQRDDTSNDPPELIRHGAADDNREAVARYLQSPKS